MISKPFFPLKNYQDLRDAGLLGLTIPARYGGLGASYETYCQISSELARWCGATALTFNMHAQTMFWTGDMYDSLPKSGDAHEMQNQRREELYRKVIEEGAIYCPTVF